MWDLLEGVRILDLSRLLPGPYATLLLADLGAEVIKIEEPGRGDPLRGTPPMAGTWSYRFAMLNRNKKSVALNLKSEPGRALFLEMARHADAILEAFRPGVAERLGIDAARLRAANPRLVYCSLSGFGQTGPYRDRVGHDLNYVGVAGLLGVSGREKPALPPVPVADLAGGMAAALLILAGLQSCTRSGEGAVIDLAMTDVVFSWMSLHLAELLGSGISPGPSTTVLLGAYPCYAIYAAADGKYLTLGALEPKFWQNFCTALRKHEFIPHQFNAEKREVLFAELGQLFKAKTQEAWVDFLVAHEVPVAPVHDLTEVLADSQIQHRRLVRTLTVAGQEFQQVSFPARLEGPEEGPDQAPPRLGQHTREILLRLGFTSGQIEAWKAQGVIAE